MIAIASLALAAFTPPAGCRVATPSAVGGITLRCTSNFPSLGRRAYAVHLPRGFMRGARLPVLLFLQTGEPYANGLFQKLRLYATLDQIFADPSVKPYVVASPDQVNAGEPETKRTYYVTGTNGKFAKWHTFVTKEFPARVWTHIMGNFEGRPDLVSVDGISLGGYNAVQYALSNPQAFRAAGCMSAAFYGPGVGFADKRLQMQNRYSDAELAAVKLRVDAHVLALRIQTSDAKDARGRPLDSRPSTRDVSARWTAAGIKHDSLIDSEAAAAPGVYWQGGHRVSYWSTILEDRLRWHATQFEIRP